MTLTEPRTATLSRCSLRYRDTGEPPRAAGSPLLLLHGGHGDWRHWEANLGALAPAHRVLVPDMPGFGESASLPGEPGPADLAAALAEFLEHVDATGVTLVGFSFGCLVSVALAQAAPGRVDRVMLVQPPGIGPSGPHGALIAAAASEVSRREGRRAGIRETLTHLMLADAAKVDEQTIDAALDMANLARLRSTPISRGADLLPALAVLPQPLQVLFGDRDPYHRHDLEGRRSRLMRVRGADCTTIVPGAAHWLQRDRPREFEALLLAFAR